MTNSVCKFDGFTAAPESFLFSLRNNYDIDPFKCPLKDQNDVNAMGRYIDHGPIFGAVDMLIADSAGSTNRSFAHLGTTYQALRGYSYNAKNTNSLLGGSEYFTPSEVEVLYII